MMDHQLYTSEVNHLNHTSLDVNDIFCCKCSNLLIGDVYTEKSSSAEGQRNVCDSCRNKNTSEIVTLHDKFVKKLKYSCLYEKCMFRGTMIECYEHSETCIYGPITGFRNYEDFKNCEEFLQFLSNEKDIIYLKLDSPSMTFGLIDRNMTLLANYNGLFFLVLIDVVLDKYSVRVGKHLSVNNKLFEKYRLLYKNVNLLIEEGDIIPMRKMLVNEKHGPMVPSFLPLMCDSLVKKCTIDFISGVEVSTIKIAECPVCLFTLHGYLKQCVNHHVICQTCADMVVVCPCCRDEICEKSINFDDILEENIVGCDEFDNGCLETMKLSEKVAHSNTCAFFSITCPICVNSMNRYKLYEHVKNKHDPESNFSTLKLSFKDKYNDIIYIVYRSKVFFLELKYNEPTLCIIGRINGNRFNCPEKYRYEVVVSKRNTVLSKVGGLCRTVDWHEKGTDTTINLMSLKNYLLKNNVFEMDCQFNICPI